MLLHHIGVIVHDPAPLVRLFRALGVPVSTPVPDPTWDAELTSIECAPVPLVIRRPTGAGQLAGILSRRGPGLHHVAFDVDGLRDVVGALEAKGVRFLGGVREHARQLQAWVDPRQAHGGLIELSEVWDRTGPRRARPGEPHVGHVGWAVRDLAEARALFVALGLPVDPSGPDTPLFAAEEAAVRSSPCSISLKAPSGPGPFSRFVDGRGPGLHHVMVSVGDLELTSLAVLREGFRLALDGPLDEGFALTQFVYPKDTCDVLVELGQPR